MNMKQKTKKAASKRFAFTAKGKVKRRATYQAHFNARATGAETRRKHHDKLVHHSDMPRIARLMPHES